MSQDSVYQDADIVWVKLGNSWWPGEVCGSQRQPVGFLQQVKRKPYCVVKFFQEDSFECVKSSKNVLPFNCNKKDEFIRKGHELFKAKKKFMEKFPSDVSTAERLTRSVTRSSLFFNSRPDSIVKAVLGESPHQIDNNHNGRRCDNVTKIINITPSRSFGPSPLSNSPATYKCSMCNFQSTRQNVMVLHRKSHTCTATVSNRNSLISSFTMTSPNESEIHNNSVSRTVSVGTSPPPHAVKSIIYQTPVRSQTNSTVLIGPAAVTSVDITYSSDKKKKDDEPIIPTYDSPSKQKEEYVSTSESISSQKKQVAPTEKVCEGNARKSEEIQKSLLADWFDEDKDEEEDDDHHNIIEPIPKANSDPIVVAEDCYTASPLAPVVQKPFQKIRNIPKKDRRNIVFTDFNSSDEISNVDALSQQSSDDARQKDKSPPIEASLEDTESDTAEAVSVQPYTGETVTIICVDELSPAEGAATMQTRTYKDKLDKSNRFSVNQHEIKLPVEAVETAVDPLSSEKTASEVPPIERSFATELCVSNSPEVEVESITAESTSVNISIAELQDETLLTARSIKNKSTEVFETPTAAECSADEYCISSLCPEEPSTLACMLKMNSEEPSIENTSTANLSEKKTVELCTSELINTTGEISLPPVEPSNVEENTYTSLELSTAELSIEKSSETGELSGMPLTTDYSKEEPSPLDILSQKAYDKSKSIENSTRLEQYTDESTTNETSTTALVCLVQSSTEKLFESCTEKQFQAKSSEQELSVVESSTTDASTEGGSAQKSAEPSDEVVNIIDSCVTRPTPIESPVVESSTVPITYEPTLDNQPEVIGSKTPNSVSKSSLSCFDFQEEDDDSDILTSIAKFKKKYISPEKNYDFGKDTRPQTPDAQKLEMELKDKQLSAEIESLLKTTEFPVELSQPSPAKQRSICHEVRTLPIKERGKRIFKSRNRNRVESCSSVSTTSTTKEIQSSDRNLRETSIPDAHSIVEQSHEHLVKNNQIVEMISSPNVVNDDTSPVDVRHIRKDEAMDDKVTNSEEEIVGRIVFAPSEVYAASGENCTAHSPEHSESHVSSSSVVVRANPIPVNGENSSTNENNEKTYFTDLGDIGAVVTECETHPTNSCDVDDRNHQMETFLSPQRDDLVEKQEFLQDEMQQESHLVESCAVVTERQTQHANTCNTDEANHATYIFTIPQMGIIDGKQVFIQQDIPHGDNLVEMGVVMPESQILSAPQREYTFCLPTTEDIDHKQEFLQEEKMAESEHHLQEISVAETENQTQSANYDELDEGGQATYIISHSEKDVDLQELHQQEQVQQEEDHLNEFFVVEESDPIYEVEVYDAEITSKLDGSNYEESNNEYELITTEVTSIEDHISNNKVNTHLNFPSDSVPDNSDAKDSGIFFDEMNATDGDQILTTENNIASSQNTGTPDGVVNHCGYYVMASTEPDNEEPSDESNSNSTTESQSKGFYHKKETHIDTLEDGNLHAEESIRADSESSSDETSTVISDAEAEFGSPTSMLEEERMLNRGRSESLTPVTNMECIHNLPKNRSHKDKVLKRIPRRTRGHFKSFRKDKNLLFQSMQYDTQESASNDLEQNSTNLDLNDKKKNDRVEHECEIPASAFLQKDLFPNKSEELAPETEECILEAEPERGVTKDDILDSSTDSDSEEEDEISSPPIEPLQDESMDSETNELSSTTNISELLSQGKGDVGPGKEDTVTQGEKLLVAIKNKPEAENSQDENLRNIQSEPIYADQTEREYETPPPYTSERQEVNSETNNSNSFYTITQKSDTIITLNKFVEVTETESHVIKSEIAGEELSAAEALLLIPNQPGNILDNCQDLPKMTSGSSLANENSTVLTIDQLKEEVIETQASAQISNEEILKGVVRRKRRSHMKVTPRKHVADVHKSEKLMETDLLHDRWKIAKLTKDPSASSTIKLIEITEGGKKNSTEQYENNFVLKYMRERSLGEADSTETATCMTAEFQVKSHDPVDTPAPEKVHITVDISNPLSSQIASILGTHRAPVAEVMSHGGAKKRKQTLEDDIPSFIIKRPGPKTFAEAEAADRETIAQIQTLCPHVEITRKSSKDEQNSLTTTSVQSVKPQIINQQILRAGNSQPLITVTPKIEEGRLDISTMPLVLSNEAIKNEKMHLVITPTTNPQVIKQFQNQQHNSASPAGSITSNAVNTPKPGIPVRRTSNVRTKRTPSRQQIQDQQNQEQTNQQQTRQLQNLEQTNEQQFAQQSQKPQQQLSLQQQYHQQHQLVQQQQKQQHDNQLQQQYHHHHHHQQQQQQQHQQHQLHQQQQTHNQRQQQNQQRQSRQTQLIQQQHHFQQQQQFQQQFQLHHQNQIHQQLQEEQQFLIQQHQQQLLLQQQLQMQQQLEMQQQLTTSEKNNQTVSNDKQMGVDSRGNKYVIIKAPSNTVVMGNNSEPIKGAQQVPQQQQATEQPINTSKQRKPRQSVATSKKVQQPIQTPLPVHSPLPNLSPLPVQASLSHQSIHYSPGESYSNETQSHFKELKMAALPTLPTKPKGRGRPPKPKPEVIPPANESVGKSLKTNGRRSSGSVCQRSTRSTAANKNNTSMPPSSEIQQSVANDFISQPIYTATHQQSLSVPFMSIPQPIRSSPPPVMCTNTMAFHVQSPSLSPHMMPRLMTGTPTGRSEGPGVGYAVPSLPVPGYPQTFLLCELIDKRYREVSSRPLYLSPDRTRFVEVPDEFLTEDHRKLTDLQREPNPDVLQVVSSGAPHILQPRAMQMQHEQKLQQQVEMEKNLNHEHMSVEEQASALLCLQQQIVQEQIVQEQLVQEQLVQEQLDRNQLVQDQFLQQQHIEGEDEFLQVATIETEEVQDNLIQQTEQVVMEEEPTNPSQVIVNIGTQQAIIGTNAFFSLIGQNADRNSYTLSSEVIQELVNTCNGPRNIVTESDYDREHIVMRQNMLHSGDTPADILTVALDDSGLYSEDQFINSGEILQIETQEGLRYIGTSNGNSGIVFQPMPTPITAKVNEMNVYHDQIRQTPKMSIAEIPSDSSKSKFDTEPQSTLEDCLSVIGVPANSPSVPTSLELPASVTNPAIVAKTRKPTRGAIAMNEIIATGLCHHPDITSLPSMGTTEQELNYDFFPSNTGTHDDKAQEESVVPDMGEYAVVSSRGNFDDPGR